MSKCTITTEQCEPTAKGPLKYVGVVRAGGRIVYRTRRRRLRMDALADAFDWALTQGLAREHEIRVRLWHDT